MLLLIERHLFKCIKFLCKKRIYLWLMPQTIIRCLSIKHLAHQYIFHAMFNTVFAIFDFVSACIEKLRNFASKISKSNSEPIHYWSSFDLLNFIRFYFVHNHACQFKIYQITSAGIECALTFDHWLCFIQWSWMKIKS